MTHIPANLQMHMCKPVFVFLFVLLLVSCARGTHISEPVPTSTIQVSDAVFSEDDETATLNSLEKLDDYPLYTMHYRGVYPRPVLTNSEAWPAEILQLNWACSLFATLGNGNNRLYGRNFDWRFSPAVLLFTDPPDGYASVSMVDIDYLGFKGERSKNLLDLPLDERRALLGAPALPFDGMNERGLAVGMAAVPPGDMQPDPDKKTIDELAVIREILDHAGTIDEAVNIIGTYNIDMGTVPIHYLIASSGGDSALVEFYQGKMVVFKNKDPWQLATNFLVASTAGQTQGQCPRYDRINQKLVETKGKLTTLEAFGLLAGVSQDAQYAHYPTQWSIVYDLTSGDVQVIMGREYGESAHIIHLDLIR